jgi:hypothetical protein
VLESAIGEAHAHIQERPPARPETVCRTGTEQFTILDTHPYHEPVWRIDHKRVGEYRRASVIERPRCRAEAHHRHPTEERP